MARTQGNWDIPAMQQSILSGEFDHTRDIEKAKALLAKLFPDNQNNKREQFLAETIPQLCSFFKKHWGLVKLVTADLLSTYDPQTCRAKFLYDQLSSQTQDRLMQLKDNK